MKHHLKRLDRWLHQHLVILVLLLLLTILRIPNFFEPYWYGDEGIYLTIGNALRDGQKLYTDIVDHKTPLIYYLASVPNQFSFRLLLYSWMVITTIVFYQLVKKFINDPIGQVVASTIFVILTTIPYFEGNIPNGELFVMGFVLVGALLVSKTTLFKTFMGKHTIIDSKHDKPFMVVAGLCFGLGILTKVPAILDLGAFLFLVWLILLSNLKQWRAVIIEGIYLAGGAILPIIFSIVYFALIGSGQDYLDYGLLYNFRYAGSWGLSLPSIFLEKVFTLPGKTAIMASILLILSIRKRWFTPSVQFALGWLVMALFASLLSNRPYPHYFMQLVPPLSMVLGILVNHLEHFKRHYLSDLLASIGVFALIYAALTLINFGPYQTIPYYQQFFRLLSRQWTVDEYRQSFNVLMKDNYHASKIIRESGTKQIFIWGTNAMLYAQSGTYPVGKYTVSFHIKDFKAQPQTMVGIKEQKPLFIVVMHDETESLIGLEEFLTENYVMNSNFTHFTLWKRVNSSTAATLY